MEFLLINHPLDCPICDQAGECELQEYSVEHGKGSSRFLERKVKKPKNVTLGPRVTLDDERCILCSRCVRFCQEIVEDDVLGFVDRGSYNTLTTHPDKQLENNYSLNTVDLCPVGALTSSDFRFQMRVWFLKETNSFCTSCARGCNTVIGSREDRVKRQTPRENNAVNSTWMCDHGRLNFHYLESDARLTSPLLREAESHRPVAWEEAISYAVTQLQKYEPQEIAIVASARMTNEELFAVERLRQTLGTSWIDVIPRTGEADEFLVAADRNPNTLGAKTIFGIEPGSHLTEIRAQIATGHVKALLCFGENLYRADFNDEMLDELEFFLCSHILANPVAQKAHVVLPGAGFAEKTGTMINATGRLQRLGVAVEPPGEARSDWEFLQELAAVFSEGERIFHYEEWYAQMAAAVELLAGTSWSKVGDEGIALLETGEKVPLLERERERLEAGLIVG